MSALTVNYQSSDCGMEKKKLKPVDLRLSKDKMNCRLPSLMCTSLEALEIQLVTLGQ